MGHPWKGHAAAFSDYDKSTRTWLKGLTILRPAFSRFTILIATSLPSDLHRALHTCSITYAFDANGITCICFHSKRCFLGLRQLWLLKFKGSTDLVCLPLKRNINRFAVGTETEHYQCSIPPLGMEAFYRQLGGLRCECKLGLSTAVQHMMLLSDSNVNFSSVRAEERNASFSPLQWHHVHIC